MLQDFFERHRAKVAALLLLLLPVGLILTDPGPTVVGHPTIAPVRVARAGVAWVQFASIQVVGGAGGVFASWFGGDLAKENAALRAQNDRLREEKSRLIGVLQENARLRQLVGFKLEHPEYEVVPARIVARNTTPYFRVITVKIQVEGATLKPRMPVLVAQGVVGLVHTVYGDFAEVVVLSDPRSRLDAVSQRNRAHGVVQGLGHDRDYQAKVSFLSEQDLVRQGDVFVTSGMGGVFPREIVVGTVSKVEPDERGLFQNVVLDPAVDLSRLEEVFVVTALTPLPDDHPAQERP